MGVPSFFRWLATRYPHILDDVIEDKGFNKRNLCVVSSPEVVASQENSEAEVDSFGNITQEIQIDNLYLDCNGIIHPCCHPETGPKPKDEDEMFENVGQYIDRIFNAIQPRKLLYLAIDGVAPRAKMNQQRARRFCSARETLEKKEAEEALRASLASAGRDLPPAKEPSWDHNVITPGTEFMARLAVYLRKYVSKKLTEAQPGSSWLDLIVIISDATVPGEGEHKIMEFIRTQKQMANYDPNTSHCICGQDADLMMLGLALHEPRVTILREQVVFRTRKKKNPNPNEKYFMVHPMQLLHVSRLRAYLRKDMAALQSQKQYDFERVVDDFVLMCFLVGNDFLPHIPSLSISDGAIDLLMIIYTSAFAKIGGYMSQGGQIFPERIERLMDILKVVEFEVFRSQQREAVNRDKARRDKEKRIQDAADKRRSRREQIEKQRLKRQADAAAKKASKNAPSEQDADDSDNSDAPWALFDYDSDSDEGSRSKQRSPGDTNDGASKSEGTSVKVTGKPCTPGELKTLVEEAVAKSSAELPVTIGGDPELHVKGWQHRYYSTKLGANNSPLERAKMVYEFVRGMAWVMHYYYQGVASWDWYYPFHYAPLASNFQGLASVSTEFELGEPFPPIAQLMSVLPAASSHCLPKACQELMVNPRSPIKSFYPDLTGPTAFPLDPNGLPPHLRWRWVAVLPFIDAPLLLTTLDHVKHTFNRNEAKRNARGQVEVWVGPHEPGTQTAMLIHEAMLGFQKDVARSSELPGELHFRLPKDEGALFANADSDDDDEGNAVAVELVLSAPQLHQSRFTTGGTAAIQHSVPNEDVVLPSKAPRLPIPPEVLQRTFNAMHVKLPSVIVEKIQKRKDSRSTKKGSNPREGGSHHNKAMHPKHHGSNQREGGSQHNKASNPKQHGSHQQEGGSQHKKVVHPKQHGSHPRENQNAGPTKQVQSSKSKSHVEKKNKKGQKNVPSKNNQSPNAHSATAVANKPPAKGKAKAAPKTDQNGAKSSQAKPDGTNSSVQNVSKAGSNKKVSTPAPDKKSATPTKSLSAQKPSSSKAQDSVTGCNTTKVAHSNDTNSSKDKVPRKKKGGERLS